ncbi:aminodeoxychorismate lyase [Chitinimonas taiwanensis]|uniref:aminodeoxychorismate lyase n=1 Tax=Chitinimonas taiwanensis DSM 18899 TaxID=1121279 RepID=A0A1K2HJ39_9NEIS|nr:aminodeoxychorismate lyase [Chitinimonas taiwanensis]SFZ76774.1 4-amino-4-deoxychorismate lyase [Chitinimonas taiwanensis DSM 18899]
MNTLVDGVAQDHIAVRDRGLAYGDGVFRTLRCEQGRLLAWPRHYAKLQADCAALGIVCPEAALLLADLAQLAPASAAVKIIITRGVSARGYACDPSASPTRIVQVAPLPDYPDSLRTEGVQLRLCAWPLSIQPGLAGIKHLNRLDQVMARREWQDASIFDGLMCNARGELVEGVMTNLYLLQGNALYTHPLADCGVAGAMRGLVLELAAGMGVQICQQAFGADRLAQVDALLLSNSLAGVLPVRQCGAQSWHNFDLAQQLHAALLEQARKESIPCCPV